MTGRYASRGSRRQWARRFARGGRDPEKRMQRSSTNACAGVALVVAAMGCDRGGHSHATVAGGVSAPSPACPEEMALVPLGQGGVCIDKYEDAVEGQRYSGSLDGIDAGTLRARPAKGT